MKYDGFKINKESVEKFFPRRDIGDIDLSGYKSPIELIIGQMRMAQENGIYKAVREQGIVVDKDELIKALRYDRGQYEKGYRDGYSADKWISVEDRLPDRQGKYLIYTHNGYVTFGYWGDYGDGKSSFNPNPRFDYHNVTHWMPVPEPPKERE